MNAALPSSDHTDRLKAYGELVERHRLLPVKVPSAYRARVEEEMATLGGTNGPLYRIVYPVAERLSLTAPGEVDDFVDDRSNMPAKDASEGPASKAIIHKYADRVLFMPTALCAGHCLYCFRQDVLSEQHEEGRSPLLEDLAALARHLDSHPDVREVILSGGDPLMLNTRDLALVLERIRDRANPPDIRIHTRAPIFSPQILDPERVRLIAGARARVLLHVAHPYELVEEVTAGIGALSRAGVRLYNHFPLLRGVNDHAAVLARLIRDLDDLHVRTLSIYVPEPIRFSAPWRISLARLWALQDELQWNTPSWINAVRFTLDSPAGKVRRENFSGWTDGGRTALFSRDGKTIRYPDFPVEMDIPGALDTLLWRG